MGWLSNMFDGGAGEAQKKNEKNHKSLMKNLGVQYGYGLDKWLQSGQALDTAFLNAKGAMSKAGDWSKKAIIEGGVQTQADISQALLDSGFTDSTMAANAKLQGQNATGANLAGLAESVGSQHSALEMAYGGAKAQNLQGLANFAMDKVKLQSDITPQYEGSGGGLLGMLGQVGGMALGGYLGGLGGGEEAVATVAGG